MGLRATAPPVGEPEREKQRNDEMSMQPAVAELVTQLKKACAASDDSWVVMSDMVTLAQLGLARGLAVSR